MAKKWNLQDIVPPDRARRSASARTDVPSGSSAIRQTPPREMRMRPSEVEEVAEPETRHLHGGRDMREMHPPRAQTTSKEKGATSRPEPAPRAGGRHAVENTASSEYAEGVDSVAPYREEQGHDQTDALVDRLEVTDGRLARVRKYILVAVALAIIGFVGVGATIVLSGAQVTVKPKTHDTNVDATYVTKIKPDVGELGYELLTLEEEGERQVAASGTQQVSQKAQGAITVLNGFSATPQKLVKNTRFEAPGGLIYRIQEGITIPGYKKDSVGALQPGSVKVKVVADGTGDTYNIADVRLNVPGLKGTDQYNAIYGEVDKTGVAGGFEGMKVIIDSDKLATEKQKLDTELRDKLLTRIKAERPNGYAVFDPAITFVYDTRAASQGNDQSAIIKEHARLIVPLFNESAFASFIAKSTVPGYTGEPVHLDNPADLTFAYSGQPVDDLSMVDNIQFSLKGAVKVIWLFDHDALVKDLLGRAQGDLMEVLKKYPAIEKAKAIVRPIWKTSFPSNAKDIKLIETFDMP